MIYILQVNVSYSWILLVVCQGLLFSFFFDKGEERMLKKSLSIHTYCIVFFWDKINGKSFKAMRIQLNTIIADF